MFICIYYSTYYCKKKILPPTQLLFLGESKFANNYFWTHCLVNISIDKAWENTNKGIESWNMYSERPWLLLNVKRFFFNLDIQNTSKVNSCQWMETCQFKYLVRQSNISGHDSIIQASKTFRYSYLCTILTKNL